MFCAKRRSKHTRDTQTRTSCWCVFCFVMPFSSLPPHLSLKVRLAAPGEFARQPVYDQSADRVAFGSSQGPEPTDWLSALTDHSITSRKWPNRSVSAYLSMSTLSREPLSSHTSLQAAHAEGYVNRFPSTQLNKRDGSTKIGSSGYHKTVC